MPVLGQFEFCRGGREGKEERPGITPGRLGLMGSDRARSAVSRHFRDAFLEMWTCWLQIVRFLPFILISAMKRLDDDVLRQHAAKEVAFALHHYRTFYEKYDSERKREADQLHLLTSLIRLFRRLYFQTSLSR